MPGKLSQASVASTPKPSCRGLWVRPDWAPEAKKTRLDQETGRVAGVGHEPGRLASLPTVSVLVRLSNPSPALPSLCLSSEPCPLDPEQQAPARMGPSCLPVVFRCPRLLCSWGVLALPGTAAALAHPSPGTHWAPLLGGPRGRAGQGLLTPGLWSLSTCSGGTPGPQHGLPRARGPLLTWLSPQHPRFPPGQRDQHRQPGVRHGRELHGIRHCPE